MKYFIIIFSVAVVFFSCQTTLTPKQTCIKECENGYRSCMEGCRPYRNDSMMDNRGVHRPQYNITDTNCSERCHKIFRGCKKSCDSTVPTTYDKSGKKQN